MPMISSVIIFNQFSEKDSQLDYYDIEEELLLLKKVITINKYIDKVLEGSYFKLPFQVEPDVERIDIEYSYAKYQLNTSEGLISSKQINIIDLSLCGLKGAYIGSSGSDRCHIWVSGYESADGYAVTPVREGEWSIVAGAYNVADEGVDVTYNITFTMKQRRLFKGDTHIHTLGSDGFMSVEDTARLASSMGLDYIFITDHNNYAHNDRIIQIEGMTVLPGTEWTHYKGHAGMLGVKKPFEGTFYTNSLEETADKLLEAKGNGAIIILNHPFCFVCSWQWGFDSIVFDGIEAWNGVMSERNLRCISWWHKQLQRGRRIPIIGGSDFHRPGLFSSIAMPCTCLYALSREPEDLMDAIRKGNCYISYLPSGPGMEVVCDGRGLGDTVLQDAELELRFFDLCGGDVIKLITDSDEEIIICEHKGQDVLEMLLHRKFINSSFCRFEIYRSYEKGLPQMLAMLSNPVYF